MYKVKDFIDDLEPWQRSVAGFVIIIAFVMVMFVWGRTEFGKTFSSLPGSESIAVSEADNEQTSSSVLSRTTRQRQTSTQAATVAPPVLSNIFITEGNGTTVDFKTTGVSSYRYMVTWKNLDNPTEPPVKDGDSRSITLTDAVDGTQAGSGKLTNLKYAFGRYEIRICENKSGQCGVRSNPIYLTVTRLPECDDPSVECPPVKSSKMTYSF